MKIKSTVKCFECDTTENIEYHHVVPRVLGGTRTIPLCSACHSKVHSRKEMNTSKLTKAAHAKMRKNNKRISGFIPYGYDLAKNGKYLIENAQEQKIIGRMKKLRVEGLSCYKIAKILNDEKIKTKNGFEFFPTTINKILQRWDKLA